MSMLEKLLRLRYIFIIAVIITFINSIFFLFLGARHAYQGYVDIFTNVNPTPGIHFAESLDIFMVALVFLVFSLGTFRIFIQYDKEETNLPRWLRIKSFIELKILLWETILMTLVIAAFTMIVRKVDDLTWSNLILPGVILILSVSLFVMRKGESSKED